MSGGSWDYVSFKIDDVASRLKASHLPERRALGSLVAKVAHALHCIEWVDSGDCSPPHDEDAIKAALEPHASTLILAAAVEEAKRISSDLVALIETATNPTGGE